MITFLFFFSFSMLSMLLNLISLFFLSCTFLCFYDLQILAGIYPVAQLQEPYSSVGYLCERTSFISVLKLKHPSLLENKPHHGNKGSEESSWTAWDVCEGELNLKPFLQRRRSVPAAT